MLSIFMGEEYSNQYAEQQFFTDINTRIRDIEEKQRILKDRMILVSESLIKEREKSFTDINEMKKTVALLLEENKRIKEILKSVGEKLNSTARAEDLMILQRQFDLFRGG
jgi:hypothetical protein